MFHGKQLKRAWQFVWVWTSELARTWLLEKKKKEQNSEVDLWKV